MKEKQFLSPKEAAQALGVSVKTIQRWDQAGILPTIRTVTNRRRIPVEAIKAILKPKGAALRCAIYARVSSAKQEQAGNLQRQTKRLMEAAKERGYEVVEVIGEQASSINEKRRGVKQLLSLVDNQAVEVVLIEYPDRLVRFGLGYLQEAFRWKGVRLEVLEEPAKQEPSQELVSDLLTLVTVFSGRLYGQRAKRVRQCVASCLKAEEVNGTDGANHETPA